MQGKGIIKALLIILLLVTAFQGLLWFQTNRVENKGHNLCQDSENPNCYADYLDSISDKTIWSIPLMKDYTYSDLKGQQMGWGLDLKGGMSAVLQVDLKEYLRKQAGKKEGEDPIFDQALANAQGRLASVQTDYLSVFGEEWDKVSNGRKLGEVFSYSGTYTDKINLNSQTQEVINVLREDATGVVKQTYNMLLQRIDKLGVVQPNITLDEARDLILVELPGIENPVRARKMLESTAELEFWKTYNINDVFRGFNQYDEELKKILRDTNTVETVEYIEVDSTFEKKDENGVVVKDSLGNPIMETVKVQKASTNLDNRGPLLKYFNPGGGGAIVGSADKKDLDRISALFARDEMRKFFPSDVAFKWGMKPSEDEDGVPTNSHYLYAIKTLNSEAPLKGDIVRSASTYTDPQNGQVAVSLDMQGDGPRVWGELTKEAFQKGQAPIAIALDGEIVSAPSVNEPILNGSSRISGGFTVQEADDLSNILEIGALPAKPRIIQEARVGPTLGAENIRTSIMALIIGFILVLLFMVAYYGGGGIVSILALLANIIFIFAALSSMGNVLTLPGIAGIVLTIGMAVDANVIIFERIREELRNDKSLLLSIKDGFHHSYSAIIDANVTTLLTAAVLFYFGLGPIKGFATVLIVGVIMSLITAVLLGRMIIDWWTVEKKRDMSFSMGWSENLFANLNIDWLSKRKISYAISGVIIIAGLISMFTRGFDLGVDFSGGYNYTVEFPQGVNVSTDDIKQALAGPFEGTPTVKTFDGAANRYAVTTKYMVGSNEEGVSDKVFAKLHEGINKLSPVKLVDFQNAESSGVRVTTSNIVGPTIADDIRNSSIKATIAALLLIFLYIFFRFRKWQFSLGAVAALFHDVLVTLALFSLLWGIAPWSLEIDQAFIAAILTVVGYSINDTVVVFDRIREFMNTYAGRTKEEIINMAVSSTVSRTIITSLTTLFVIMMLFIFGSGSIKSFAFALMVGVIVGTYSSIFIATPVMNDTTDELKATEKAKTSSTLARKKVANP